MEPSGLYLREYTHLHETTLTSDGRGTDVQVSLCKDKDFFIDKEGERAFKMLKLALIEAPILSPN